MSSQSQSTELNLTDNMDQWRKELKSEDTLKQLDVFPENMKLETARYHNAEQVKKEEIEHKDAEALIEEIKTEATAIKNITVSKLEEALNYIAENTSSLTKELRMKIADLLRPNV